MNLSVLEFYTIGIGPSSSHTVGPMRAARLFALALGSEGRLARTRRVQVELYGSLGATGKGHGSDKAVLLGLAGFDPETVEVDAIAPFLAGVRERSMLPLAGGHEVAFHEKTDLLFYFAFKIFQ